MSRHHHNTGGSSIDFYACNCAIRTWSPGFKIGFSMLMLLFCIAADNPWISLCIIFSAAFVTVYLGKLPLHHYLSLLTIPAAFLFFGSIAVAVDFSLKPAGDYQLQLFGVYLYVTKESLKNMLFLILKVFGAVSAMFVMTLSTPSHELFSVLKKLHFPQLFVELMSMIYRYIFILLEVQHNMHISAKSRLGYLDFKTSCLSFGQIAGNLFIVSLKKANACYDAMEARCYDGTISFLEEEHKSSPRHLLFAGLYFAVLGIIWFLTR